MTLPFAALGAIVAALLETTVMPEVAIFGVQANLLLTLAVTATVIMGIEDGLVWAFLGGLLVDMLTPARPIGATTFVLLVSVGLAAAGTRFVGQTRAGALLLVFVLTWAYHVLLLATLALTEGVAAGSFDFQHVLRRVCAQHAAGDPVCRPVRAARAPIWAAGSRASRVDVT